MNRAETPVLPAEPLLSVTPDTAAVKPITPPSRDASAAKGPRMPRSPQVVQGPREALRYAAAPMAFLVLFCWSVFRFGDVETLLAPIAVRKSVFTERTALPTLALEHIVLAGTTSGFAAAFATGLALVLSTRGRKGRRYADLADRAASFGETFPSVALMAILVPSIGYGFPPVGVALFLYGLLPVFRNAFLGLNSTPAELIDAATGSGMTARDILFRVRLPLALPLMVEGLRVSLVVNISAATLGAAVGAGGFGVPIVSGIRSFDLILILKGALPVSLLALFADSCLGNLGGYLEKRFRLSRG